MDLGKDYQRLVERIEPGGRPLRARPLAGGVSAQVTAVDLQAPDGQVKTLVLRCHGAADRRQNPNIAADEFALLTKLHHAGLPVPQPRYLDRHGELLGCPGLVVDYIAGRPEGRPAALAARAGELAAALARIHVVDAGDLGFLPDKGHRVGRWLAAGPPAVSHPHPAAATAAWAALRKAPRWPGPNGKTLLHGDFWPGNLLWREGRLSGIIDWEDACLGDPLADLANSRLELLWACDGNTDAVADFTRHYLALRASDRAPATLPYWDLYATLEKGPKIQGWGLDQATELRMRRDLGWFLDQALAKLSRAQG